MELTLRGGFSWPGCGQHGEDWLGFVCLITRLEGTQFERNPEDTLEWIDLDRIGESPLWDGDHHFLPLVFDANPPPLHGVMRYREERLQWWSYSRGKTIRSLACRPALRRAHGRPGFARAAIQRPVQKRKTVG